MRRVAVLLLFAALSLSAATSAKKKPPVSIAPDDVPHTIAQFLRSMSRDGGRQVVFKATASGTRFFFEEASGVTVYRFENGVYIKEEFLRGSNLAKAVKRYARR